MKEKTLLILSIVTSFVGILGLLLASYLLFLPSTLLSEVPTQPLDATVKVTGEIIKIQEFNTTKKITVGSWEYHTVDVIMFIKKNMSFRVGENITVVGTATQGKKGRELYGISIDPASNE